MSWYHPVAVFFLCLLSLTSHPHSGGGYNKGILAGDMPAGSDLRKVSKANGNNSSPAVEYHAADTPERALGFDSAQLPVCLVRSGVDDEVHAQLAGLFEQVMYKVIDDWSTKLCA